MPPTYRTSDGKTGILSVSSKVVAHVIEQVNWTRPIYFSTYVEPARMIGLDEFMSMEGMVFRLTRQKSGTGDYYVNASTLERNINERYVYRGITDPTVYKSPETSNLLHNYFIAFVDLCENYMKRLALTWLVRSRNLM